MLSLYVDGVENCAHLVETDITAQAASLVLPPGSYTIRIDSGGITKPGGPADPERVVQLWIRGGRHLDRATNVATHSRFRSLCGSADVLLLDVSVETTLYAFWFEAQQPYPAGGVKLAVQTATSTRYLDVKAPDQCVPLPGDEIAERAASMPLATGTYVVAIDSGAFICFPDRRDAEPMVLLWVEGGQLRDRATGQVIPRMVRTLNGYGACHVIDVLAPSLLRAFWFGGFVPDHSGAIVLKIREDALQTPKYRALLIDGRSEHPTWAKFSTMLTYYLEQTGLFQVDRFRAEQSKDSSVAGLELDFSLYDVVVLNYSSTTPWPPQIRAAFESYVSGGGGFVAVHSSGNAFPSWPDYNAMTALGGWHGRDEQDGFYLFYDDSGTLRREKHPDWPAGQHPPANAYLMTLRDTTHPIVTGLPATWMHAHDELYSSLRGPADQVTILATAYSDPTTPNGTGRHEPLLMTVAYGRGRVFHTTLGHTSAEDGVRSAECVAFITTFQRGAEWAASGAVTQSLPADFPTASATSSRPFPFEPTTPVRERLPRG
jgi:type 1 glutamine amidotransferase